MCSENSRSQIVFRTDIFRKLTLGNPVKWLTDNFVGLNSGNWFTSLVESTLNGTARHSVRRENGQRLSEPHFIRKQAFLQSNDETINVLSCHLGRWNWKRGRARPPLHPKFFHHAIAFKMAAAIFVIPSFLLKKKSLLRRLGKVCLQ